MPKIPHPTRTCPQVHKHVVTPQISFFKALGRVHRFSTGEDIGNTKAMERACEQMPWIFEHIKVARPDVSDMDKHLYDLVATQVKTHLLYAPNAQLDRVSTTRRGQIKVAQAIAKLYPDKILLEQEVPLLVELAVASKSNKQPSTIKQAEKWIQVISSPEHAERCKIGLASDPESRLRSGYQNGALVPTVWVYRYKFADPAMAGRVDNHIKQALASSRVPNTATETYTISAETARMVCLGACNVYNAVIEEFCNPEWER